MNHFNYNIIDPVILGWSQKGQDSLIQYTFDAIGETNKYYIEFGACDGYNMSNTAHLRHHKGWTGLLLEGNAGYGENPSINLHTRFIDKDNICDIFKSFNVPQDPDFLCVDMDGMDYWILKAILEGGYSPRVIMTEVNVRFDPYESKALKYDPTWNWDGRKWYGASPYAFKKMLNSFGYVPVWIAIDDMIVIRKDIIDELGYEEPSWDTVYNIPNTYIYSQQTGNEGTIVTELDTTEWIDV